MKNKYIKISCFVLTAIICFVLLLPTYLSTSLGKQTLLLVLNTQIPGKVDVQSLNLSWFGSQHIQQLTLKSPDNELILTIPLIHTESSWIDLLRNKVGPTKLQNISAIIKEDATGLTNIHRALGSQYLADK